MTKSPRIDLELFDFKQADKVADDQSVFKDEFPGYGEKISRNSLILDDFG